MGPLLGGSILPGESVDDAYERLLNSCMEQYGFSYTFSNIIVDNVPRTYRVYDGDPDVQARHQECMALAAQGAGGRKLSPEELKGNWEFQTALWTCLAGRGYDVGTLVSLEEFVAAGGAVDAASKASDFGGLDQPNADADMQACVAELG